MTVSIIGAGNLAWHLVNVFEEHDLRVAEVYSRKKKNAESITGYLYDVNIKSDLDFSNSPSKLFILAVSDDAIAEVAKALILPNDSILVHTSGGKAMDVLNFAKYQNPSLTIGVFYPLMTFSKGIKVDFKQVPLCLEAENDVSLALLRKLAMSISDKVDNIDSEQRAILHVAAVFSCNFTNHMWALGKEIADDASLDFEMLKPLITETFKKAMKAEHPANVQTGPAVRDDFSTIEKHRNIIKEDEELLSVYDSLTKSIQDWYQ
ncbi:Rossmann-like and DUF2520 domain-containing protein [Arcticibacterium luteifluviistationis]|uniref:DUF2520 domain-containing protein n=1 Tax=Arcticibacterium luteifluviistationis TaxID=1784714 RepID=A0A2Z4G9N2_9BACT|nr:Rossmann-like and DUF2520 domain-containing protein [Arcticibacterium luteifluviistationis]AWV97927.1 DUF2520 domain-containing protein [Arcticibacterium luteifluviistationis]